MGVPNITSPTAKSKPYKTSILGGLAVSFLQAENRQ